MRKKLEREEDELEILKAVAQAWHAHSSSCRPTSEFDAHRRNVKNKPTRFKLEAMKKASLKEENGSGRWDFSQSLWDSYEIVTVSKKLEMGLVLDRQFSVLEYQPRAFRRSKESKNSLRNLFNRVSSRRFNESDIPIQEDTQF